MYTMGMQDNQPCYIQDLVTSNFEEEKVTAKCTGYIFSGCIIIIIIANNIYQDCERCTQCIQCQLLIYSI